VLVTLSEPVASGFAAEIADKLSADGRLDIVGSAARRGWRGGAADIVVRIPRSGHLDEDALDAAVDRAVMDTLPYPRLTLEALVMVEVVPADRVHSALAAAHVTAREALRGMGLY
jgi:hypothetical protein